MVGEKKSKQVKFSKKLAGTNWGIGFNTLRNSAVALVHSTAEHAAPGWSHSWHVKVIDTVLNDTLRLISRHHATNTFAHVAHNRQHPTCSYQKGDHLVFKFTEKQNGQACSLVPKHLRQRLLTPRNECAECSLRCVQVKITEQCNGTEVPCFCTTHFRN